MYFGQFVVFMFVIKVNWLFDQSTPLNVYKLILCRHAFKRS